MRFEARRVLGFKSGERWEVRVWNLGGPTTCFVKADNEDDAVKRAMKLVRDDLLSSPARSGVVNVVDGKDEIVWDDERWPAQSEVGP